MAHRWLGLVAGLGLVLSGVTGSALVFRREIDLALNPRLLRAAPGPARASFQQGAESAARAWPAAAATRVRMPDRPDGTWEFWMGAAPDRYVYVDPWRGTVLGSRAPSEFLTGWLFLLHSSLLAGELGNTVAGVGALALVLLSTSGIVIWWPRRTPWRAWAAWRAALVVERRRGGRRFTYDLHRATGFYASLLLLVAGLTGASLVFHERFESAAHWLMGTRPESAPARPSREVAGPRLPLDSLLAIAERAQPGGTISYLYLPAAAGQSFRVRRRLPGEEHPNGKSFVHVDAATGRVLGVEDGARASAGARLYSILYPLHIGVIGGRSTRVLALLVGLTLPALAVSGALVYWRRGKSEQRAASRP